MTSDDPFPQHLGEYPALPTLDARYLALMMRRPPLGRFGDLIEFDDTLPPGVFELRNRRNGTRRHYRLPITRFYDRDMREIGPDVPMPTPDQRTLIINPRNPMFDPVPIPPALRSATRTAIDRALVEQVNADVQRIGARRFVDQIVSARVHHDNERHAAEFTIAPERAPTLDAMDRLMADHIAAVHAFEARHNRPAPTPRWFVEHDIEQTPPPWMRHHTDQGPPGPPPVIVPPYTFDEGRSSFHLQIVPDTSGVADRIRNALDGIGPHDPPPRWSSDTWLTLTVLTGLALVIIAAIVFGVTR